MRTLVAVMLFKAWFGAVGIAPAMPLAAALRVAVLRMYVDDRLQNSWRHPVDVI